MINKLLVDQSDHYDVGSVAEQNRCLHLSSLSDSKYNLCQPQRHVWIVVDSKTVIKVFSQSSKRTDHFVFDEFNKFSLSSSLVSKIVRTYFTLQIAPMAD